MLRRCGPPAALFLVLALLVPAGCSSDDGAADTTTQASTVPVDTGENDDARQMGSVHLVDRSWVCRGQVDMDLVKVEIKTIQRDAVYLRENCTGRIGRIEIDTWQGDGVKVNVPEPAAHDLVVGGGYIRCHAHGPGGHQDGIQVMSGERITFENLEILCSSDPNAQFYVSALQPGMPTDVVCDGCLLGSGAAQTLFIDESVRSGARDTLVCPGRFRAFRIDESLAEEPVLEDVRQLPEDDRRCRRPSAR